jgi:protein required for attachment to host cells
MKTTWIVSADTGRARIFAQPGPNSPLEEIETMANPDARRPTSDDVSDRIGPFAGGQSSHATGGALPSSQYEPRQTLEAHEEEQFSRFICASLLKAKQEGRFDELALVAAPRFLGALRAQLDPQLKQLVSYEIDKDYSHSDGRKLQEQIVAHQAKS